MSGSVNNIRRERHDNLPFTFNCYNASGGALDLTGYSAPVLAVNTEEFPTDVTNEVFKVTGVIAADPTTGVVTFAPTADNMDQPPAKYYYNFQMLDASGARFTYSKGSFTIDQDIAKD